ncbi:MAG: DUF1801 domain-containing protein [Microbacteriaceae bacterium]|nr:DUF1801 domain-containing protein [Microbacteriaceae bacterium]
MTDSPDASGEPLDPVAAQLTALPASQREVLAPYWARAEELVPDAVRGLSYGMPALKHRGFGLVSLMPTKAGFSVYPYGNDPVTAVMAKHPGHEHTKGSIHFTAAAPLPWELFDDLVRFRAQAIEERASDKKR